MNMSQEITTATQSFASELTRIIVAGLTQSLGGIMPMAAAPSVTSTSRPKPNGSKKLKAAAKKPARSSSRKLASTTDDAAPGQRRTRDALAATAAEVLAFIVAHPGARMEAIREGTGISTARLQVPIKLLLAEKKLNRRGHKRATEYYPAKKAAAAAAN